MIHVLIFSSIFVVVSSLAVTTTIPSQFAEDDDFSLMTWPQCPSCQFRSQRVYVRDFCTDLCIEFRANRSGNGYDLCEPVSFSTCQLENLICEFLYWSVTDDGLPGLVYSVNGTDLTEVERISPVTCAQAREILSRSSPIR